MQKRFRTPKAKEGELLVKYGQEHGDRDLFYCWPENECGMRHDSRLVMHALERCDIFGDGSLRKQLEERGYDITSLKFTIRKAT